MLLRLFPSIRPYETHLLPVQEPYTISFEESGSPDGIPVLVVHGGPGAGSRPDHRRYFDPNVYRVILFDQRGCGKSTPLDSTKNNSTQALLDDIEAIRAYLNIEQWVLFGGSWGSTLSLLYAQAHPERVRGLILRSVLLANDNDRRWFFQAGGASRIYPHYWEDFIGIVPPDKRDNLLQAYAELLNNDNELVRMKSAKTWSLWHRRCATINPLPSANAYDAGTMRLSRLECYYFINKCFIKENQILNNMYKIKHLPGIIVHGRYDMITPVDNSYLLKRSWHNAELDIVRDAGHASSEPALMDAIVKATEKMAKLIDSDAKPSSA